MDWSRVSAFGDEVELDLEDQLEALGELQIEHLELRSAWGVPVDQFDATHVRRARSALASAGMSVSAIASPVGKSALSEPFASSERQFRRCLEIAGELEASLMRVFSYYVDAEDGGRGRSEVVSRLTTLAGLAEMAQVVLVHENERGIYGESAIRCRDLVATVNSRAFRACFDPANFVQSGVPVTDAWDLLEDEVVHVHVKDAKRDGTVTVAGEGEGRWPSLLAALRVRGYEGFLALEPHLHSVVDGDGRHRLRLAADALRLLLAETSTPPHP